MNNLLQSKSKKRKILFGYCVFVFCLCCRSQSSEEKIQSVKLFSKIDLFEPTNHNYFTMVDSVNIYLYKNMALYQIFYLHEIIDDREVKEERHQSVQERFFIHRQGDTIGVGFSSLNKADYLPVSVKSFLAKKALTSFSNYYNKENDSLIQTFQAKDQTVECYVPKNKFDDSYCDTTRLFFSDQKNQFFFTFSKYLDSLRQKKLFKVQMIYNQFYRPDLHMTVPRREFIFEMEKLEMGDDLIKELLCIFGKYEHFDFKKNQMTSKDDTKCH